MEIVAIIENVRSLQNVGSIFRTADGLGIKHLYLTGSSGHPHPTEPWRRDHLALTKTALGAEQSVTWTYAASSLEIIEKLQQEGYQILSIELAPQAVSLDTLTAPKRVAIVVGNEVDGIEAETLAASDQVVAIPMQGRKESFNVSIAFALAAYHLLHLKK
jgi:tRNA G18 (ribose-2'-O)-methylase SpoU